jgi:hypothetical protein
MGVSSTQVGDHWGSARTVQPVQAHFFHGKSVTCVRQAVPLALSSFEWTPSSLPRLGLTGQAIPIMIRRDASSSSSSILLFERVGQEVGSCCCIWRARLPLLQLCESLAESSAGAESLWELAGIEHRRTAQQ